MREKICDIVDELLRSDKVQGVVGLSEEHGNVQPRLFRKGDSLDSLVLSPKYPLATICRLIQSKYPELKLGTVVRGCDERALIELAKRQQIDIDKLVLIGVACTEDEARECCCEHPYPQKIDVGEKVGGVTTNDEIEALLGKDFDERLKFWSNAFSKCIKCYGCRNACPLCICEECIIENDSWVKVGEIPPEFPSFHLIRAYHLSDKCIGCGECQKACPMDIPLTILYALLRRELKQLFAYEPGMDIDRNSPLATTLEQEPIREVAA